MRATVLLVNFKDKQKLREIQMVLMTLKVKVRLVEPEEYYKTIGELVGIVETQSESDDDESESDNEKYLSKKGRKEQAEKDRIKPKVRFYGVKENNKVKLPSSKVEMKKEVEKRKEKRTMSLGERAKMLEKKPKKRYN